MVLTCISLMISDVEHFFHILAGHLYVFFREMSVRIFCTFFNRYWWFCHTVLEVNLYILKINPLPDICFANIVTYSVGCIFTPLIVSFAVQKLLSLMQSHLSIFAFVLEKGVPREPSEPPRV